MRLKVLIAVVVIAALAATVSTCDRGDYLGPLERGARAAIGAWDFWATEHVRPYETPMPRTPAGTVPVSGRATYERALAEVGALPEQARPELADRAYGRFCQHCHGPSGDNRTIVGESFGERLPDMRSPRVQDKSDQELYYAVRRGSHVMIPLATVVSPRDTLLAIHKIRTLVGAASRPYFSPKFTEPIGAKRR